MVFARTARTRGGGSDRLRQRLCLWLLVVAGVAVFAADPAAVPTINQAVYDFGKVVSGVVVSHDFEIVNPTDTPLEITRIRTSCGCTAGKVEPETIGPQSAGKLHVVFRTGQRTGAQRKHIFISTRHPDAPLLRCSVEGMLLADPAPGTVGQPTVAPAAAPRTLPPPAKAEAPAPAPAAPAKTEPAKAPHPPTTEFRSNPSALLLGTLVPDGMLTREVLLSSHDDTAFEVTACGTPLPGVSATCAPADASKKVWKLTVQVKPAAEASRLRGYVSVSTNRSDSPVRILVTGRVAKN